ncbi:MAG: hypothetical protein PSX81_06010 [bacterium]|nr:hypothetical protein [bacterium]
MVSNDLSGKELKGSVKMVRSDFLNEKGDSAYCIQAFDSSGFLIQYYCNGWSYGGFDLSENYIIRHRIKGTSKTKMGGGCTMYGMKYTWRYNLWGTHVKKLTYRSGALEQKQTLHFNRQGKKIKSVSSNYIEIFNYSSNKLTSSTRYNVHSRKKQYTNQSFNEYDTFGYLIKQPNLYYDNGFLNDTCYTTYTNDKWGNMTRFISWSYKDKRKQVGGLNLYEYDSIGNWIKIQSIDTTGKVFYNSTRTINYYEKVQ